MAKLLYILSTLLVLASLSGAAKILVVFPVPGGSHSILGEGFVRTLAEAGHEVTYVTPIPPKNPHPNQRLVDTSAAFDSSFKNVINVTAIMNKELGVDRMSFIFKLFKHIVTSTLENEDMQKLMNDPNEKFDVIIIEWMLSDVLSGLSAVFDCPYIWSSSMEPHSIVTQLIDDTLNPAYNSGSHSNREPPFTFLERVAELFMLITFSTFQAFNSLFVDEPLYQEIFKPILERKGRILPPLNEIKYNASLMFGNSHVSMGKATRLPQNYISIGGYHIKSTPEPLPEDLKKLMDNSKGVIYFSMGSNVKSKDFPDDLKKGLVKMFGELEYTVLWKFEDDLPNLPKNLHILKWAPQPSILSHPNLKLFITHGGLLSTTEAIHYGVPIIGIPVFGDQFINVEKATRRGYAKHVPLSFSLAEDLKEAIGEVIKNPTYAEKVKELSAIYHDRLVSPRHELVHWVEHVVRTRGATHLRSPALRVRWYQKMYLDLAVLVITVLCVLCKVSRKLFNLCFKKKVSEKKKKN